MKERRIRIDTSSKQNPADGLTKAIPQGRRPEFLQHLGLMDIELQLEARRQAEFDTLEDRFEMLEN